MVDGMKSMGTLSIIVIWFFKPAAPKKYSKGVLGIIIV